MRVLRLQIKNFRNIGGLSLEPCDRMNVICGENAQGKTNIVEAIWLFTGAKSFRGSKDKELVLFGKEQADLELDFFAEGIKKDARLQITEKRSAVLNNNKLKTASQLAGSFNAIVFSPNDLSIVKEGPALRRRFLDIAIGSLYPSYIELLRNYTRAVTQRNRIIKDFKNDSGLSVMLDAFENEIAINGEKIINLRKRYVERLNEFLPVVYSGLSSGKEILDTSYLCVCEGKDLSERLVISRKEDMFSGKTSVGPHRDDLVFKINGVSARSFGSQGQKRSVALSLKLSEAEVIKKSAGESPVFLLDDVMSELDPERQNFVLNHIEGMQAFLTCCDPSNFKNLKAGKIFKVSKGSLI
ncbi:MAG: DNA replication/repair protein RecF [Clostridia bacterium]|nr:DNA replication/repair protein RecF [Clostridia bacterium]